jgi:hypothetical protein
MMTADRLQLALDNGLTMEQLTQNQLILAIAVMNSSEPIAVLTLAKVLGLQWVDYFTDFAADEQKYELLQWLRKCGCPWNLDVIAEDALDRSDLEHMKQLRAVTGPWAVHLLSAKLWYAGVENELDIVKWLREQGAEWPTNFNCINIAPNRHCWSLQCVQWALANGSTWLGWRCQDLASQNYSCSSDDAEHVDDTCDPHCDRKYAAELFEWAHENGCPCTCGNAAVAAVV